tara:strand:- start:850 stop:1095 length:246 start_codon:yes stop_codon:yes gene_type:complete
MAEETKKALYSEKTAGLKGTLALLNVKNAQAMKLLDEKYAVKNDVGRKKRNVAPAYAERGLAQLGSSVGMKMPQGYRRPRN